MALKCFSAIAIPTAIPSPCPKGPVAASTPGVVISGCPGVLLPRVRNCFRSEIDKSKPAKCKVAYNMADAWPPDKTKRSRLNQCGSATSNCMFW